MPRTVGAEAEALRVLLVDADPERAAQVSAGLTTAGYAVVAISADPCDLTRRVRETGAELVVCALDDPSRDALESMGALHRDEPRPVVLFTEHGEPEQIDAALQAGVAAYVVEGLASNRIRPVVQVAVRRFQAYEALRQELETAKSTLADRIAVDRAKLQLMQRGRISEEEAYRRLRRMAMDRGRRLADVAQTILNQK